MSSPLDNHPAVPLAAVRSETHTDLGRRPS
jgi:hypothetical protein